MIIYKATNLINNKTYIGQTTNTLEFRKQQHFRETKSSKKTNTYFHNALQKYGFDNFSFEIIDTADSIESLNEKEIYWIDFYHSTDKSCGYNLDSGGKSGGLKSDLTKQRIGEKSKERWNDDSIASKMREGLRKGTETVKRNKRLYEFICPVCGKKIYDYKYAVAKRKYCSKKCAVQAGSHMNAVKTSAILNHQRNMERKQQLKLIIVQWAMEHTELVLNCPYNKITSTLHELFEMLSNTYGIKDIRTIFACFNVESRKELLSQLKQIINTSKENIC